MAGDNHAPDYVFAIDTFVSSDSPLESKRFADAMTKAGGRAHGRLCDALDQSQVDAVVASVVKEFGRIDVLVNAVVAARSSHGRRRR